jgi:hypothetical protein
MQKVKKTFPNRSMSGSKEILIGTLRFILTVIEIICNKADFCHLQLGFYLLYHSIENKLSTPIIKAVFVKFVVKIQRPILT